MGRPARVGSGMLKKEGAKAPMTLCITQCTYCRVWRFGLQEDDGDIPGQVGQGGRRDANKGGHAGARMLHMLET